jgi:N-formylglutamate amidohydrolase
MGMGLVRRLYRTNRPEPIYNRLLSPAEVEARLENYYRPYHRTLETLLNETYDAFGCAWHINCHSMPAPLPGLSKHMPDIVLGDRDGTTCDPGFTRHAATVLKSFGYRVAVNRPYKGVELVRKFAAPHQNRHSLQIEVRRSLYMDETTRAKIAGFTQTRRNMRLFVNQIIDFTKKNMTDLAAD